MIHTKRPQPGRRVNPPYAGEGPDRTAKGEACVPVSLIPRGVYPSVTQISPKELARRGIKLVLADLDNTLAPYKVTEPAPEIRAWKQALEEEGIQLFLLSNNRRPSRARDFAKTLGIPFQGSAGKPKRRGYLQAMARMGCTPEQTVMVGDQIFTDTLGANRAGVTPLLVRPIRLAGNPGRYLRYAVETPFRLLGAGRPFL